MGIEPSVATQMVLIDVGMFVLAVAFFNACSWTGVTHGVSTGINTLGVVVTVFDTHVCLGGVSPTCLDSSMISVLLIKYAICESLSSMIFMRPSRILVKMDTTPLGMTCMSSCQVALLCCLCSPRW